MAMAQARLTETVDLPTPPLPLAIAMTWRTWSGFIAPTGRCGASSAWARSDRPEPRRTRTVPGAGGGSGRAVLAGRRQHHLGALDAGDPAQGRLRGVPHRGVKVRRRRGATSSMNPARPDAHRQGLNPGARGDDPLARTGVDHPIQSAQNRLAIGR